MPNPHPSPEAIRAMDGPELTALAWQFGLAPPGTERLGRTYPPDQQFRLSIEAMLDEELTTSYWQPHLRYIQADAVFRQLRARGFATTVLSDERGGMVHVYKMPLVRVLSWREDFTTEHEEALALLRCAVLAVCREGEAHG